jgi:hypothetical protein
MKRRLVHTLQSVLPGFFTEPEPARLIEHKARANARTIQAHARDAEPIVVRSIEQSGNYAVLDNKRRVLVAHLSFQRASELAKTIAMEKKICTIVHRTA